jgi:hypothetical protein
MRTALDGGTARHRMRERGSLLASAVLILTLLAISASTVLPILDLDAENAYEEATYEEMERLAAAIVEYYEDTLQFPATLADLVTKPDDVPVWMGPYVPVRATDATGAVSHAFDRDEWGTPYRLDAPDAFTRDLVSLGHNRRDDAGSGDDLSIRFAVHHILWKITIDEMKDISAAMTAYNAAEPPPWLPPQWEAIVNVLQAQRYLPVGPAPKFDYRDDGWGQEYNPVGHPPAGVDTEGPPTLP